MTEEKKTVQCPECGRKCKVEDKEFFDCVCGHTFWNKKTKAKTP